MQNRIETEPESEPELETDIPPAAGELPVEAMAELADQSGIESVAGSDDQMVDESDDSADDAPEDDIAALAVSESETPPAAMPSMGATDAFIPARAVQSSESIKAKIGDNATKSRDTVAAGAAPEPVAELPKPAKKISLFERVTGGGRAAFGKKVQEPPKPQEKAEGIEINDISAVVEAPAAIPEPELSLVSEAPEAPEISALSEDTNGAVAEAVTEAEETEQSLGGMDIEDRLPVSESTDDLLDIPAFLRRQAN